jgi:hypothetical protein
MPDGMLLDLPGRTAPPPEDPREEAEAALRSRADTVARVRKLFSPFGGEACTPAGRKAILERVSFGFFEDVALCPHHVEVTSEPGPTHGSVCVTFTPRTPWGRDLVSRVRGALDAADPAGPYGRVDRTR